MVLACCVRDAIKYLRIEIIAATRASIGSVRTLTRRAASRSPFSQACPTGWLPQGPLLRPVAFQSTRADAQSALYAPLGKARRRTARSRSCRSTRSGSTAPLPALRQRPTDAATADIAVLATGAVVMPPPNPIPPTTSPPCLDSGARSAASAHRRHNRRKFRHTVRSRYRIPRPQLRKLPSKKPAHTLGPRFRHPAHRQRR